MYTPEGVSSIANFFTVYEESQQNRDFHFLSVMSSMFLKATFQSFIITGQLLVFFFSISFKLF